jgi:hypothetical protein
MFNPYKNGNPIEISAIEWDKLIKASNAEEICKRLNEKQREQLKELSK